MKHRFVLVDVFADRPLAGNPLAVFPEAAEFAESLFQPLAREMDHPATAFLLPSTMPGAAFRLKIFSREREIPFAGHSALGAHFVHAIESRLPLQEPVTRVAHEGDEGLFEIELSVERGEIRMLRLKQRLPESGPRLPASVVARVALALGLEEEEVAATNQPVRIVSTGFPVLIVPVATLDALAGARPRYGELKEILEGREATLVYVFTKETRDTRSAAHARAFETVASAEVPGAGAAAGALAAYLVSESAVEVLPVTPLIIEQGHALSRPSTLYAEVQVSRGQITQVMVGGRVIRVGEGTVDL